MTVKLAFYKGKGDLIDKAIRWWTKSPYSHCEIVIDGQFYTSSPRDGGVRSKVIDQDPEQWDFVDISLDPDFLKMFFQMTEGAKYDWVGIVGSQIFNEGIQSDKRWFCSEWCAFILGYERPAGYSPGDLYKKVTGQ